MAEERVQRRLAAILATDAVGYSRLMGVDEESTLRTLKSHCEIIDRLIVRHEGRIFSSGGDSVLAEFGSAVEAVRAAISIQEELRVRNAELAEERRMNFRIGINVGDIMVEGDNLFGDGVNVAARLEGLAEAGGICISGSTFDQVKNKLSVGFEDIGPQQVKNIAEPVRAYRARTWSADTAPSADLTRPLPLPDKPSIAVLPFDNIGNDEEQEYFADGITEDLITALARIHSFFVTARNSSFSYKGQSPDIRQVADDLGVRYVLEGSVRKAGSRVRITSQLIDGTTGNHLWAERYDREIGDVFDLQDEMTEKIVGAIEPAISKAEIQRSRSKRPDNLDAWDLCQHGWWHRYRNRREDYVSARSFFERAIEKDPEFVSALAGLADTLAYEVVFSFAEEPAAQVARAIDLGRRAVEIDDEDPVAHLSLGRAYLAGRQFENGIRTLREALRLNPYFAGAHYSLGGLYIVTGRFQEGIDAIRKMIALSPQDLFMGPSYARLAQAFLAMKDYEKAVENAEEAFRCPIQPHWPGKSYLVSALGHLGRQDEARQAIEELQGLVPGITINWVRSQDLPISMGQGCTEDYLDGLHKAGLPE